MALTTTTLPAGQLGAAYSATLTATGGTAPYTRFTVTATDSSAPVQESLSEQFTVTIRVGL